MRKFENFPQVCYLSLKESSDRRENLHNQFINYKIQNVKSIISNRFPNQIHNDNILSGEFIDTLTNQSKGNLISHMEALNLMTSKISEFDYFFVCEDDLSFETVQYWNFNWNEFIGELPNDWDIVQLLVIRDDFNNKLGLRKREWNDWSAAAYIIKNDYAKKLLNKHLKEIYEFNLEINGVKLQPLIENILYTQTENCYSIPLFVEEVNKFESTIINNDDTKDGSLKINGQGKSHITSYNEVINWWRTRNMKMENTLIEEYALNTENPEKNYDLAKWYHKQQQTASAISYYLRCADRTDNKLLQYECLIHMANCFISQGNRDYMVRSLYRQAITVLPKRPEAYFQLARFDEWKTCYSECYALCCIALELCDFDLEDIGLDYPGKYGIIFEKSVSGYWLGKSKECRDLLLDLKNNYEMDEWYKEKIGNNLQQLGYYLTTDIKYNKSRYNSFKFKFNDLEIIEKSEGQGLQDMFVLSILNGLKNGTYLEVGAQQPQYQSNTYILEKYFNWSGVSIEILPDLCKMFSEQRINRILCEDATKTDYKKVLTENYSGNVIDYLQLDCEPSKTTFEILLSIPFHEYEFKIITYEHDDYADTTKTYKNKSRNYLKSLGYELLVSNVSLSDVNSFEDWWIKPEYFSEEHKAEFRSIKEINNVSKYFYNTK